MLTAESGTIDGHQLETTSAPVYSIANGVLGGFSSYEDDVYPAFWSAQHGA